MKSNFFSSTKPKILNIVGLKNAENTNTNWTICRECGGRGRKKRKLKKKVRLQYRLALENFEKTGEGTAPIRPLAYLYPCSDCNGSGLVVSTQAPKPDEENFPHVAIIGGGIGGVALAVACLHRGIPFTVYERDNSFDARSQGYGLTLQQASKAIEGLGLFTLAEGVVSTRHLVHKPDGKIIGEWGMRKWLQADADGTKYPKRTNVHISRQALRLAMLQQLGGNDPVQWGHRLVGFKQGNEGAELSFEVNGVLKTAYADLLVGADGIRSSVRELLIGNIPPLRYLGCIVILGICPLDALEGLESDLLDSATVFQTANGNERIYVMPYSSDAIMWQLSFPMPEKEAKALSAQGAEALKAEACRRTQWHHPIPQILEATLATHVSGYPVYDRELLQAEMLDKGGAVTLIGDAAHPMSPFKGQGANQALLDALALARGIFKECRPLSNWREQGIRQSVLSAFETEMLERSAIKVKDSAEAADFLHSDIVLHEGDEPRGKILRRKNSKERTRKGD